MAPTCIACYVCLNSCCEGWLSSFQITHEWNGEKGMDWMEPLWLEMLSI